MGNDYSKADLRSIVEGLIDELRECEDGMPITTARLLATPSAMPMIA